MIGKKYIPVLVVFSLVTIAVAYAATQIVVQNNVTVHLGSNIGVTIFQSSPFTPACPTEGSTSYVTSGSGLPAQNWNISTGGSQTQYMCEENVGTGSDPASVALAGTGTTTMASGCPVATGATNDLGYTVAGGPTGGTLGAGGVAQWTITVCANSSPADTGAFTFSLTVN